MTRTGWTRLSDPKAGKCAQRWRHDASGLELEHAGHPTALWPWAGVDDDGALLVTHTGRAFQRLEAAMVALEDYAAGRVATIMRVWDRNGVGDGVPLRCIQRRGVHRIDALITMLEAEGVEMDDGGAALRRSAARELETAEGCRLCTRGEVDIPPARCSRGCV